MRILFFSHYYVPEVNAPASRTSEHARAWAAAGHDVTIVTCAPNHPAGRVYPGYANRLWQTERIDGVTVHRVWTYLSANEGFVGRIFNYLSFLVAATLALPRLPKPDVIVTTSPQLFCGLVGLPARYFKRAPWVLEIRDLWPESIVTVGAMRRGFAIRLLERVEALAYRKADSIVAVTDSFVPHISARGGAGKVDVIKNGVDLELFRRGDNPEVFKHRVGFEGRFVAAYVGTHGMAHGLDTVLDAAKLLRDDPRIGFVLVGDGADRARLATRVKTEEFTNVRVVGQLPKADMPVVWAATDASLILLRRTDAFRKVLPSKMFEAMAMRCPIVLGVEGEARALLKEADAGIGIMPEDAAQLAAAVLRLATDRALGARYGQNGLTHVRAHFDRNVLAARMLDVLVSAVRRAA